MVWITSDRKSAAEEDFAPGKSFCPAVIDVLYRFHLTGGSRIGISLSTSLPPSIIIGWLNCSGFFYWDPVKSSGIQVGRRLT